MTAQEWGEHGGYHAPLATVRAHGQVAFGQHTLLVRPQQAWERLKVAQLLVFSQPPLSFL